LGSTWSVRANLQNGSVHYSDREYSVKDLPALCAGSEWIRTAKGSQDFPNDPVATFTVSKDCTIYLFHNEAIKPRPLWLEGWTDSGNKAHDTNNITFRILTRKVSAGTVISLGPNGQGSMYFVAAKS
jgi:hypothetical protein